MTTHNERGVVLLCCLIILTILSVIATSFADKTVVNLKLSQQQLDSVNSFTLAEDGLEAAENWLRETFDKNGPASWAAEEPLHALQNHTMQGSFSAAVVYLRETDQCTEPDGRRLHFELIAVGRSGQYAAARHASGISVCMHLYEGYAGVSHFRRDYWKPLPDDYARLGAMPELEN